MHKIQREAYLAYARSLRKEEVEFIYEFSEWLPSVVIDSHSHCNLEEHVVSIDERAYSHMLSTFPSFSMEESKEWHNLFFPGKQIRSLRFPKTFRGIDHRAANLYLLEQSSPQDRIALYGLPDDIEYTIEMLDNPRVSALKMYYSYLEPPATKIYQYFPREVLSVAQDKGIPIILHPPRKITECLDQIIQLLEDFPFLRVCIAHLGLSKRFVPGLEYAFRVLAKYPLVNFDTALNPSSEVVTLALRTVGSSRIMYGSDEPLSLIRSTPYVHPILGERLITEYEYHWVDKDEHESFRHLASKVIHAHWSSLNAIKIAIGSFQADDHEYMKQNIFHDNAKIFYGF